MTVPMYEAKSRLSEYVKIAENGDAVLICKYNRPAAVIISQEQFEQFQSMSSRKLQLYNKRMQYWRSNYAGDLSNEDVDTFTESLEQMRAASKSRPNPFLDETFFN